MKLSTRSLLAGKYCNGGSPQRIVGRTRGSDVGYQQSWSKIHPLALYLDKTIFFALSLSWQSIFQSFPSCHSLLGRLFMIMNPDLIAVVTQGWALSVEAIWNIVCMMGGQALYIKSAHGFAVVLEAFSVINFQEALVRGLFRTNSDFSYPLFFQYASFVSIDWFRLLDSVFISFWCSKHFRMHDNKAHGILDPLNWTR